MNKLAFFFFLSLLFPSFVRSEEASIVLESQAVSITVREDTVSPKEVHIKPGTTVSWINESKGPIKVRFVNKAISTTCKDPRRFQADYRGVNVSNEISTGDLAALCFLSPEQYRFEIDRAQSSSSSVGLVTVSTN